MTIHKKIRHPAGAKPCIKPQSFNKWADFPKSPERNTYAITGPEGSPTDKIITGRAKNRILLALINGPLECASKARIGMFVGLLRHECGLSIQTDEYVADNEAEGGAGVYGIYTLETKVTCMSDQAANEAGDGRFKPSMQGLNPRAGECVTPDEGAANGAGMIA